MIDLTDPTVWVAICLLIFIGIVVYAGVPKMLTNSLDNRADEIRKELEEARRLREEAQAILADYQRKQRDAEKTAEEIINQAQREAESYAEETRKALKESIERRTRLAEEKITRAQNQAASEVKAAAIDVAISATERLIMQNLSDNDAKKLIEQSVKDINSKIN